VYNTKRNRRKIITDVQTQESLHKILTNLFEQYIRYLVWIVFIFIINAFFLTYSCRAYYTYKKYLGTTGAPPSNINNLVDLCHCIVPINNIYLVTGYNWILLSANNTHYLKKLFRNVIFTWFDDIFLLYFFYIVFWFFCTLIVNAIYIFDFIFKSRLYFSYLV